MAKFILFFFLLSGCSILSTKRKRLEAQKYFFTQSLGKEWQALKKTSGMDLAFENVSNGNVFMLRSECHRYQEKSLEKLFKQTLKGFENVQVRSTQKLSLDHREAVETLFSSTIDGVKTESSMTLLRKNNCLFDFFLTGLQLSEQDLQEYRSFIASFKFKKGEGKE